MKTDVIQGEGGTCFVGKKGVDLFRMITLLSGLRFEVKTGMRLSRMRSCYAAIKSDYGLRGNKARVLAQFTPMVEAARSAVTVEVR